VGEHSPLLFKFGPINFASREPIIQNIQRAALALASVKTGRRVGTKPFDPMPFDAARQPHQPDE
jgi:hypothetical protein